MAGALYNFAPYWSFTVARQPENAKRKGREAAAAAEDLNRHPTRLVGIAS